MSNHQPIRVLLVDDSPLALVVLERLLSTTPDIRVAGTCRNGQEALEIIPLLNPDVVCTDLNMPGLDGLELTRQIMARFPMPVLIISTEVGERTNSNVFELLEAGALDVFLKPALNLSATGSANAAELVSKIRILAGVRVFRRLHQKPPAPPLNPLSKATPPAGPPYASAIYPSQEIPRDPHQARHPRPGARRPATTKLSAVAIGASTGGPQALQKVLGSLPATFGLPIFCVQHIGKGFLVGMVEWLSRSCAIRVKVAQAGEQPRPGTAYFGDDRGHLRVTPGGLAFSLAAPEAGHRPSASVLMASVASHYGAGALGVLLTGMGSDGASGMQAICAAGGITIAQNEDSCVVFGMPRAAIAAGAANFVMPLDRIGPMLARLASGERQQMSKTNQEEPPWTQSGFW